MKKPNALCQLLEELRELELDTSVITTNDSACLIHLTADGENPIRLTGAEAELLLHSKNTVEQLFAALDEAADAAIELHSISVEPEVQDTLEHLFCAVDEF